MSHAFRLPAFPAASACLALMLASGPATASCFESGVGCTDTDVAPYSALRQLSCDSLWTVRNSIYNDNGYCFKTARAKAVFDNSDCQYTNASLLPLNSVEQINIGRVVKVEKEKHC